MPSITSLAIAGTNQSPGPTSDVDAWANPENVQSDGLPSSNSPNNVGDTDYLRATFSGAFDAIPAGAKIEGLVAEVTWFHTTPGGTDMEWDNSVVRIVKAGTGGGSNRMYDSGVPAEATAITYGNLRDLWGNTLTVADVKDEDFGFEIGFCQTGDPLGRFRVLTMKLTVYYSERRGREREWRAR